MSTADRNRTYMYLSVVNVNRRVTRSCWPLLVICPIAIAYSMGQIIKSVCVCQCVCVSVCGHSHGRISWSIFTKIGTNVKTTKSNNEFVGGSISHFSPILPHKTSILGQEVLKIYANVK